MRIVLSICAALAAIVTLLWLWVAAQTIAAVSPIGAVMPLSSAVLSFGIMLLCMYGARVLGHLSYQSNRLDRMVYLLEEARASVRGH